LRSEAELSSFYQRKSLSSEKHFRALGRKNPAQAAHLLFVVLDGLYTYLFLQLAGLEHRQSEAAVARFKN